MPVWLQQLVSAFLAKPSSPKALARKAALAVAALGLAWMLVVAGIVALLYGMVSLFSLWLHTTAAILTTGAVAVVGGAIILFWQRRTAAARRPAEALVVRFPVESVAVAAVLGFVLGNSEEIRTLLLKQLFAR